MKELEPGMYEDAQKYSGQGEQQRKLNFIIKTADRTFDLPVSIGFVTK